MERFARCCGGTSGFGRVLSGRAARLVEGRRIDGTAAGVGREMSVGQGSAADPVWDAIDLRAFLADHQQCTTPQVAFRLAYELPPVALVAVGTSNVDHLRDLCAATRLAISETAIHRYRELITG
ncbi:hypothetical protein AB8O55_25245 [Saccharopolyspora cebuensis]|uniref:NADP-dependent oxidoreductase domain-containing protein n=1 Tax=Saccharopolyspora cebuensis TaxID=418759 RepID=A0ABV4CNQ0_9PSEU